MNIHHLELFYYVAKHQGIGEAVRRIPYGIQQPAVSSQIRQLEDSLGTKLFERRPFQLTQTGRELYDFIRPFFDNLDTVAEKLRGRPTQWLRIAASKVVLRDYLPDLLTKLEAKHPDYKLGLRERTQGDIEGAARLSCVPKSQPKAVAAGLPCAPQAAVALHRNVKLRLHPPLGAWG